MRDALVTLGALPLYQTNARRVDTCAVHTCKSGARCIGPTSSGWQTEHPHIHCRSGGSLMAKLNEKTALINGSTDGVGRVVAKRLADGGWRVLVHGRDRGRGEALVAEIKAAGGTAEFLQADLSSIAEVRRLADAVQKTTQRLDLLINSAGLGSGVSRTTRRTSADGYELLFAVNYLAGFLLSHLLLPLLKKSAPARIVNVSSLGQQA